MPKGASTCNITNVDLYDCTNDIRNDYEIQEVFKQSDYKTLIEYCTEVADKLPQRESFYTIDLGDVLCKVRQWKKLLPRIEIFYAVKTHTDPVLMKLVTLLNLSFDCTTQNEIQQALATGASPQNIIFANTIKTIEELKFAADHGIDLMAFDNEEEILKISKYHKKARLVLRLRPAKVLCKFDLSDKFGCSEDEALQLLSLAKTLELNVVGISFHVGEPSSYKSTIQCCHRLFNEAKKLGFDFKILDIGGGFFGDTETESLFFKMVDSINDGLQTYFPGDDVRVIAEPGTYIIASAVKLVCTIIGKKVLKNTGEGRISRHYFFNNGVFGSFFLGIEEYNIILKPLLSEKEANSRVILDSRIFGQTSCSLDVIRPTTPLPDMMVGERVIWENMGAYSRNICTTFCGAPLPQVKYILVRNHKLTMDWIENKEEVLEFLSEHCAVIASD